MTKKLKRWKAGYKSSWATNIVAFFFTKTPISGLRINIDRFTCILWLFLDKFLQWFWKLFVWWHQVSLHVILLNCYQQQQLVTDMSNFIKKSSDFILYLTCIFCVTVSWFNESSSTKSIIIIIDDKMWFAWIKSMILILITVRDASNFSTDCINDIGLMTDSQLHLNTVHQLSASLLENKMRKCLDFLVINSNPFSEGTFSLCQSVKIGSF